MRPNHHMSITCCLSGCDGMHSTHPSTKLYRPNKMQMKAREKAWQFPRHIRQYNQYGKMFWIPTQVEPTVPLIGTSVPAMLCIGSAASLQVSSAIASSLRLSGSDDNQRSQSHGHNNSDIC